MGAMKIPAHRRNKLDWPMRTQVSASRLRVVESGDRTAPAQAIVIFNQMKTAATAQIAAWQHFKASDLAKSECGVATSASSSAANCRHRRRSALCDDSIIVARNLRVALRIVCGSRRCR